MDSKRLYSSFTSEQIRAIGDTALEVMYQTNDVIYGALRASPEQRSKADSAAAPAALALKFCSQAIALLRDASLFWLALECAEWSNLLDEFGCSAEAEAGLAELVRCELLTSSQLRKVSRSRFSPARGVLAESLPFRCRSTASERRIPAS
jgi:hypothetical protein